MRPNSAVVWLLVVCLCGGLASKAHSAVPLPSSSTSQQLRSLLQTSPASNGDEDETSCLQRAKQYLQEVKRNVTEPTVSPCSESLRAAERSAQLSRIGAQEASKRLQALKCKTSTVVSGCNVTESPVAATGMPLSPQEEALIEEAANFAAKIKDKKDKEASGFWAEMKRNITEMEEFSKNVSKSLNATLALSAASSASSPLVSVGRIILCAIFGLAVLL